MKIKALALAGSLFLSGSGLAATIAIIDSGVDYQHEALDGKIWTNPLDSTVNRRDEDGNGFRDDIHGWNFFGNNHKIINYKYNDLFSAEVERFFLIQGEILNGTVSDEDLAWVREKVGEPEFVATLNKFGAYVHGTHVAGIAAAESEGAKVLAVRLLPVENPLERLRGEVSHAVAEGKSLNFIIKEVIKVGLRYLAQAQAGSFARVGEYLNGHQADVANASLGMSMVQARMILTPIIKLAMGGKEPSSETVDELASYFVERSVQEQAQLAILAPKTLFVFAAGNDGTNNDQLPVSPANIKLDNTMTVGALLAADQIAPFSNYGMKVDLLAPGVAINSAIPNDLYMPLTGTSQAAPKVAGVAASLLDANPQLSPIELKKILISTVDRKDSLKNLVKSSGILNSERALYAAKASLDKPVADAIAESMEIIPDAVESAPVQTVRSLPFKMPALF